MPHLIRPARGAEVLRATEARASEERAYRAHERAVMAMLAARHRELDADSRYELYHEAWASVLKRRSDGVEIESLEGYLVATTDKLASKRLYGADARRRVTFDPVESPFASVADTDESPEEAVLAADEARRVRMLIGELAGPEQALLKLRLDLGLEPTEIRAHLRLTDRQYRRIAERARKALLAQFTAFDTGAWARGKRSLLCACALGIASERQRERARLLIEEDPCCRAMMSELRRLGGQAAAVLPLPATPAAAEAVGAGHGGRIAELLAAAKQQAAEALAGAKQGATGAYVRVSDPTPLAAVRPGAVATLAAGCLAAGGSAYCAVEGIPNSVGPTFGLERPLEQGHTAKPEVEGPPSASKVEVAPAKPPPPRPMAPVAEAPPAVERPATPAAPAPAAPAPAAIPPAEEFEPVAPAASSQPTPPDPAPPAPSRPAPAPASGGSTEFQP